MSSSGDEDETLHRAWTRLYNDYTKWQAILLSWYPGLQDHVCCIDLDTPEEAIATLPSFFNEHTQLSLGIGELVQTEFTLHKGQAHDALAKICMAIHEYTHNLDFKHDHVRGQCAVTHAEGVIQKLEQEKKWAGELYRHAYSALLGLGLAPDDWSL